MQREVDINGDRCSFDEDDITIEELIEKAKQEPTEGWVSIKDELPKNDVSVLVTDGKITAVKCYSDLYEQFGHWTGTEEEDNWNWIRWGNEITHWMPLPSPPKQ